MAERRPKPLHARATPGTTRRSGSVSGAWPHAARFPLADPLPSTDSAGLLPLFARFPGTMRSSDFPTSYILGVRLAAFPRRSTQGMDEGGISRFPCKEFPRLRRVFDCAGSEIGLPVAPTSVWPSASENSVGTPDCLISQLNGWPACAPVNASPPALRPSTHDSGSGWLAGPFPCDSCIHDSLPVSRRTFGPTRATNTSLPALVDVTSADWRHCVARGGGRDRVEHAVAVLDAILLEDVQDAGLGQDVSERQPLVAREAGADSDDRQNASTLRESQNWMPITRRTGPCRPRRCRSTCAGRPPAPAGASPRKHCRPCSGRRCSGS